MIFRKSPEADSQLEIVRDTSAYSGAEAVAIRRKDEIRNAVLDLLQEKENRKKVEFPHKGSDTPAYPDFAARDRLTAPAREGVADAYPQVDPAAAPQNSDTTASHIDYIKSLADQRKDA